MRRNTKLTPIILCTAVFMSPLLLTTSAESASATEISISSQMSESKNVFRNALIQEQQTYVVPANVAPADVTRDGYSATSQADLDAANAAAAAALQAAEDAKKAEEAAAASAAIQAHIQSASTAVQQRSAAAQASSANFSTSTATTPEKAAYVDLALNYVGVPYVFGGATPAGWDCSGYVLWVYAQKTGVTMPHGVGSINRGYTTPVAASAAQPGDLVFFPGNEHVGIYLGNGMMVHAPKPGDVTKIAPIWTSNVTFGSLY